MKRMTVVSLFDLTGNMVKPWTDAGHRTIIVDTQHRQGWDASHPNATLTYGGDVNDLREWLVQLRPDLILAFPPCTDLAVSGARHFAAKREKNPDFQTAAVALARMAESVALEIGCPYMIENPVSVLSTLWRKPDHTYQPWHYSGYLGFLDTHPDHPEYTPPRDHYSKRTCLWTGNGFVMPALRKHPDGDPGLSAHFLKLGGRSLKTKNIRSATPRGFAKAVYLANSPITRDEIATVENFALTGRISS